jgi:hypothetical protein
LFSSTALYVELTRCESDRRVKHLTLYWGATSAPQGDMKSALSRPGTGHGQRPQSSLSQRPGSRLSSHRPLSRISNRPISAASRQAAKVAQLTQTLVTQLLASSPDGARDRYSYALDTAMRCLDAGGGPSQTIEDTDRRVNGWVVRNVL